MAHSREVRLPFLSHELVEFMFSLPSDLKIRRGETKYILRRAFSDLLAEEIRNRRDKIGYEPPQAKWLDDNRISELIAGATTTLKGEGILHRRVDHSVQSGEMSWRILALGHLLDG
jgi:asparagine synthase (glutamine-hydrolysing)